MVVKALRVQMVHLGSPGPSGPPGPPGPDLSATAWPGQMPTSNYPTPVFLYDSSCFDISIAHEGTDGFRILSNNDRPLVLPFSGDISNNRPKDLSENQRLNHSAWLKIFPDWSNISDVCGNAVPIDTSYNFAFIPIYWYKM